MRTQANASPSLDGRHEDCSVAVLQDASSTQTLLVALALVLVHTNTKSEPLLVLKQIGGSPTLALTHLAASDTYTQVNY